MHPLYLLLDRLRRRLQADHVREAPDRVKG
jgi:hypothetical protein